MKREHLPLYAIAAAVLVGLIFADLPPTLLLLLACPPMMIFMMRGMGHGGMNHGGMNHHDHDDSSARRENSPRHHNKPDR